MWCVCRSRKQTTCMVNTSQTQGERKYSTSIQKVLDLYTAECNVSLSHTPQLYFKYCWVLLLWKIMRVRRAVWVLCRVVCWVCLVRSDRSPFVGVWYAVRVVRGCRCRVVRGAIEWRAKAKSTYTESEGEQETTPYQMGDISCEGLIIFRGRGETTHPTRRQQRRRRRYYYY